MESYYLNTLIFFFKTQRDVGYKAIEQVLNIIDNDVIPDARKRKALFQVLRSYGLNETTFKNGRFEFAESVPHEEIPPNNVEDIVSIVTQTFYLRLLNGVLEIAIPIN